VSAPLFLVEALPAGGSFTLDGPEGHHAATVQRLRVGEALILADGRGGTASAEVTAVARGSIDVAIIGRSFVAAAEPRLVVVQGIAKGDRGELAVQAMTEVGVDEIVPWAASRSVAQWRGDRGHKARDKWAATAREAAKQARRAWLPMVAGDPDCSTKQVAARLSAAGAAFVLHEEATERLTTASLPFALNTYGNHPEAIPSGAQSKALPPGTQSEVIPLGAQSKALPPGAQSGVIPPGAQSKGGEIVLVVGPEGGISAAELDAFVAAGAKAVRLGDSVLRTSTAGIAALSVLSARLGRW
jgi:16S rRNA (uracil1498-N3)-methyltransferase